MIFKSTFLYLTSIGILLLAGCASEDDSIPLRSPAKFNTAAVPAKYTYSIYLENSGSLNGYLKAAGDSSFKDNINNLITEINGFAETQSLNLYDVNTKIIPVALSANAINVSDYIGHLDAPTFKKRSQLNGGDQSQSNLSNIIRNIIDSTHKDEVSMLISDCIFSPGKNDNALNYLSEQRSSIQICISEKLKRQLFSTLVLQFVSDFNGIYYDQNNVQKKGNFKERPYYVVCFGREDALHNLLNYVHTQNKFRGFRNFLFLTNTKSYNVVPHIWPYTVYYEYDLDQPMTIEGVKNGGRDNKFRIKLGVDFSNLPVSQSYINDHSNYILSNGYAIDSIVNSDKSGFTHQIILIADRPRTGKIQISLKKQLPVWITTSNLDSDSNLSPEGLIGKTFGIRYMFEGINGAYEGYVRNPNYFTFSISVKE